MGVGSDLLSKYTSDISFLQATSIRWDMNTISVHPHHFENSIPGGSMSAVGTRRKMLHGWSCASRVFSYHKFGCLFPSYQNSFISLSLSLLGIIILAATTTFNYNISPFSLPFSQLQSTPLQSGITFLPLKGTCSSGRPEEPTHHFSSLCCIQKTPMNRLLGFIILPCSYT